MRVGTVSLLSSWLAVFALVPCRAFAQLPPKGQTIEYSYDGRDIQKRDREWWGRTYLHPSVQGDPDVPRPVVVYLHGVNKHFVRYSWMGGGESPDMRMLWDELIDEGMVGSAVLAAPSTAVSCKLPQALWMGFDLDNFLARTIAATRDIVRLDLSRVIVVGHSGAGCNRVGGIITALQSAVPVQAGLVIDVCMDEMDAPFLARARPEADVVVTYQHTWRRSFETFSRLFLEDSAARRSLGLRRVEELPVVDRQPHATIVKQSLSRWLPRWLPPKPTP